MDLTISKNFCGNKSCIGLMPFGFGQKPKRLIIIEDEWVESREIIEDAIIGLISHETIEFLLAQMDYEIIFTSRGLHKENLNRLALIMDIHQLIGEGQTVKDYCGNHDGIVETNR